ncbi:hypothetical protein Dimus_032395 [Dionaea muscipula]
MAFVPLRHQYQLKTSQLHHQSSFIRLSSSSVHPASILAGPSTSVLYLTKPP